MSMNALTNWKLTLVDNNMGSKSVGQHISSNHSRENGYHFTEKYTIYYMFIFLLYSLKPKYITSVFIG